MYGGAGLATDTMLMQVQLTLATVSQGLNKKINKSGVLRAPGE